MTVQIKKLAILGAGSMGGAILSGLQSSELEITELAVTNRSVAKAAKFDSMDRVTSYALENTPDGNKLAAKDADVVMLGVKPAGITALLGEVAPALKPGALIITMAAGITTDSCAAALSEEYPIVRVMPNTPALIGQGMTGIARGRTATDKAIQLAIALFETVGKALVLPEEQIDALGTISGSGPAYVFFLIEQLTKAAKQHGFTPEDAALMVQQTFLGAINLQSATGSAPAELRRRVTSPNGTTERAIAVLAAAKIDEIFVEATQAALVRSRELAAGA